MGCGVADAVAVVVTVVEVGLVTVVVASVVVVVELPLPVDCPSEVLQPPKGIANSAQSVIVVGSKYRAR